MKNRVALALGLASLIISGLTLFSVLAKAESSQNSLTIGQNALAECPGLSMTIPFKKSASTIYRYVRIELEGDSEKVKEFCLGSEVKAVMILFNSEAAAQAARTILTTQKVTLVTHYGVVYSAERGKLYVSSEHTGIKFEDGFAEIFEKVARDYTFGIRH